MDVILTAVNYIVRIGIPIFFYRLARSDGNSKRTSLAGAAFAAGLFQLAEASLSNTVYLDGAAMYALGTAAAARFNKSSWPFKAPDLEGTISAPMPTQQ